MARPWHISAIYLDVPSGTPDQWIGPIVPSSDHEALDQVTAPVSGTYAVGNPSSFTLPHPPLAGTVSVVTASGIILEDD